MYLNKEINHDMNYDTGEIIWKIKVRSNASDQYGNWDGNSKASLDGYIIEDVAFAGLTPNQVQDALKTKITYNASSNNYQRLADQITLTKIDDTHIKVTVSPDANGVKPILSELELFYYTKETVSTTGSTDVSNTAKVSNASGSHYAIDEETKSYPRRDSTEKTYSGNPEETVVGTADQTARIQSWKVTRTNDAHYHANDEILNDTLKLIDGNYQAISNTNIHYISKAQAEAFTVKGGAALTALNTLTEGTDYEIIFKDQNSQVINFTDNPDAKAVSFSVKVKRNLDYPYITVEYQSTADISQIPVGSQALFQNEYGNYSTANGLKFTRKDITDVETMRLKVRKSWDDTNNKANLRPQNMTFTVERTTTPPDANGEFPANTVWETAGTENFSVNNYSADEYYTLSNDYDRWKVVDGAAVYYYYRISEPEIPNYAQTAHGNAINAETASNDIAKTYTLTNTVQIDNSFHKNASDLNGNAVTARDFSNLPKAKIRINGEETEYYIFTWKLSLHQTDQNPHTYTDILPENAVLVRESNLGTGTSSTYLPKLYGSYSREFNEVSNWGDWWETNVGTLSVNGQQMTLITGTEQAWEYFLYSTAIPVAAVHEMVRGGTRTITNTAYEGADTSGTPKSASLTVTGEVPPDKPYFTKEGSSPNPGELTYHFEFNPEEKQLSAGDTVEIVDCLQLKEHTQSNLSYQLSASGVKIYTYNADGTRNSVPLSSSNYSTLIYYDSSDIPDDLAAQSVTNVPVKLVLNVPDRTHLYVEYTYDISGYKETKWHLNGSDIITTEQGDNLQFCNTVLFRTDVAHGMETSNATQLNVYESHASVTVTTYPQIYKVDVSNFEIKDLFAKFKIAKYDADTQTWIFASGETSETDSQGKVFRSLTFVNGIQEQANDVKPPASAYVFEISDARSHNVELDDATLYKFVEVEAPSCYF